jgi:ribonuclease HII
LNPKQASINGMYEVFSSIKPTAQVVLIDAEKVPKIKAKAESIIKGDAKEYSIAAASIIAKVTRDRMMLEWDKVFPQYGFAKHKGYGTAMHIEALKENGPCMLHRRTFIKNFID